MTRNGRLTRPTLLQVGMMLLALGAGQSARAQSPADASPSEVAASPTTDLLAQTVARSLSTMQQTAMALTLPPPPGAGQPLNLTGIYFADGTSSPLVDQKIAYTDGAVSLSLGYRSVSKSVSDAGLLAYRTGKDADLPDALNQLLAQRGKSDLNAALDVLGPAGLKFDYKIDAQTDAPANNRAKNQSLGFEKDSHASAFSFLHSVASQVASSGNSRTTTDELKYAYTPAAGLSLTGDASASQGAGKSASQWRLGVVDKLDRLNFGGEFWSSETSVSNQGGAARQDARQDGETFKVDGQIAPAVTVSGFYNHEMIATDQTKSREDFDAILKSAQIHQVELMAEFSRTQQMAQAAETKRQLQAIWSLPHFIGVTSAKWVVGLTDRTVEDQSLRRDITIGFESRLPTMSASLPGLSGAALHLEFAGNAIGGAPMGGLASASPNKDNAMQRHSRLLRLVSAPQASRWLTWSVAQQTRVSDQGASLPTMRDYEVTAVVSPALSVVYSDRDQIPQDDGTMRDTKAQTLSVTVSRPHSAQVVAAFVHGADVSNGISGQDSASLGLTSPSGADQTMSLSLGRDRRTKPGGSSVTGTTCKTAFDWREDAKNLLGFNGSLTAWDHSGAASDSIEAEAHLHFERVY